MSRTAFALALVLTVSSAMAQSVISAHSGTVQFTEGQVTLDGAAVQPKFGEFPDVKTNQVLATQDGRSEILLTPGVFLRIGENTSFKMISNQLSNTRLEIQSGEAMIQVGSLLQDNSITVVFHGADVSLAKSGLYRFEGDTDPAKLLVYEGEASVVSPTTDPTVVRKGHELAFSQGKLEAKTFDAKAAADEFYRWNARRDEYVAQANIVAAKTARDSGSGMGFDSTGSGSGYGSGLGTGGGNGQWAYNPWMGMFTYLPSSGTYFSPFGFGYFSPYAVSYMYGPSSPYYGTGGSVAPSSAVTRATTTATTATALNRSGAFNGAMANSTNASPGVGRSGGLGSSSSASSSSAGSSGGIGGHAAGGGGGAASGGAAAGGKH
jgi:hypothetical protein